MKNKNIGIGKVYTYRIDFSKNKGQGYVAGPDYVKTRNVGIGRFPSVDTQQDPSEGLVRIDGEVRYVVPEKYASVGPQPVPVPAPMTLRFLFSKSSTDPATLGPTRATWTKVDNHPAGNVWDWTYDNTSWRNAFTGLFTSSFDPDVKLIDAGDTSNVANMSSMFNNCSSLTSVSLFDTSNITNMSLMFLSCSSLKSVPLFDTSKVTNMYLMFSDCSSLESVPLFDTSKVTDMSLMFMNCYSLTSVPLFNTSSVNNMLRMFRDCSNVESGALALYQQAEATGKVTNHGDTFLNCGINTESGLAELQEIPQDWGGLKIVIPEPADMTLRFLFSNETTDPTVIQNGGTWTKIENHPDGNVWDWTCTDTSWQAKFSGSNNPETKLPDELDIRIIGAGDTTALTSLYNFWGSDKQRRWRLSKVNL